MSSAKVTDQTTDYAERVVSGDVVAGSFVRMACERHLRDLEAGASRGLVWSVERAERALRFFPAMLTVTEGAAEGQPFTPLPWHVFVIGSLFGWLRSDGLRRFRWAWLETGKGQAKSPLMAALGIYLMGWCGKQRSQVYAIASDKDQANVLFKDAVAMCRAAMPDADEGESLESDGDVIIRGVGDNAWKIEHPSTSSFFQAMASVDAISGPRPSCVLADEIHEFKTSKAIQLWKAAIDKMSGDPLMILGTNTPGIDQIVGTEYSEYFQRVLKGIADDDTAFAFIARVDEGDDPFEDEGCWGKSLPALGITFPIENVRARVKTARQFFSEALSTKRLYFGVPVGSSGFWIDEGTWLSVQGEVDLDDVEGKPCWGALDLSRKNDLTALSIAWDVGDRLLVKTWYWTTLEHLSDRERADGAAYGRWVAEGHLVAIPGATIDKEFVAAKVSELHARFDLRFLAFDSAMIAEFTAACDKIGFQVWRRDKNANHGVGLELVSHGQGPTILFKDGALSMPKSFTALEDAILSKSIVIDRNAVTGLCAVNAHVTADAQNNRYFDKKRSRGRIDGMVTIAMAVGAAKSVGDAACVPTIEVF